MKALNRTVLPLMAASALLVGGAEISTANAATTSQDLAFTFFNNSQGPATQTLNFTGFNTAFTYSVSFGLNSIILNLNPETFWFNSAKVNVNSPTSLTLGTTFSDTGFNFGPVSGLNTSDGATTSFYSQAFGVDLVLTNLFCSDLPNNPCSNVSSEWEGSGTHPGLTVTYDYSPVPLPAALPLFATGLGGLGLLGWRRKRKAQAVA